MSEPPPPAVAEGAPDGRAQALTPEAVASVLADFRNWLAEAPPPPDEAAAPAPAIDLHTLLGQFLALRHDVNLQTRATRAQQEQTADALQRLSQALDTLRQVQVGAQQGQQSADDRLRPLLKTLLDLHDSVALAARETERIQETVLPFLEQLAAPVEPAPQPPAPASWWARLRGRGAAPAPDRADEQARRTGEAAGRVRQMLASLMTGYTMSLQRVERALRQHGLEPIAAAGEAFDPERMEVLEAVGDSGRPAGEVLEEVRRGYLWNGRVFRYAQVRVARS